MERAMSMRPWSGLFLAALAMGAISASPAKDYPDFAERKPGLGPIALLTDLVVVEDVNGDEEKVYREDCRSLGASLMELVARRLEEKGYTFSSRRVVSVGQVVSGRARYRVLDTWAQHKEDVSGFPILAPPFYQDSSLAGSDSARAAWHELINGVWAYPQKRKQPATALASIAGLREVIGADYALVVVVVGSKIPVSRGLLGGSRTGLPSDGFVSGVDMEKYVGAGIRIALLDCRNGDVLWSDREHHDWRASPSEDNLELLSKNVLNRML